MAQFPIIVSASPFSITTGSSLTYAEFVQTLFNTSYHVEEIYLESDNVSQLTVPFTWQRRQQDGTLYLNPTNANIDPYQSAAVLLCETDGLIDINNSLSFTLNPNSYIELCLWTDAFSFGYFLSENPEDEKKKLKAKELAKQPKEVDKLPNVNRHSVATLAIVAACLGFLWIELIGKE